MWNVLCHNAAVTCSLVLPWSESAGGSASRPCSTVVVTHAAHDTLPMNQLVVPVTWCYLRRFVDGESWGRSSDAWHEIRTLQHSVTLGIATLGTHGLGITVSWSRDQGSASLPSQYLPSSHLPPVFPGRAPPRVHFICSWHRRFPVELDAPHSCQDLPPMTPDPYWCACPQGQAQDAPSGRQWAWRRTITGPHHRVDEPRR